MLQDIIDMDIPLAKVWIMPIIQGYVEIKQCKTFFKENQKHEVSIFFAKESNLVIVILMS